MTPTPHPRRAGHGPAGTRGEGSAGPRESEQWPAVEGAPRRGDRPAQAPRLARLRPTSAVQTPRHAVYRFQLRVKPAQNGSQYGYLKGAVPVCKESHFEIPGLTGRYTLKESQ